MKNNFTDPYTLFILNFQLKTLIKNTLMYYFNFITLFFIFIYIHIHKLSILIIFSSLKHIMNVYLNQSKKGSSDFLTGEGNLSESGYEEKLLISPLFFTLGI